MAGFEGQKPESRQFELVLFIVSGFGAKNYAVCAPDGDCAGLAEEISIRVRIRGVSALPRRGESIYLLLLDLEVCGITTCKYHLRCARVQPRVRVLFFADG